MKKTGRKVYTAGGAISRGQLLRISAADTVVIPSGSTQKLCLVALSDAASGEQVECESIHTGDELELLCTGSVSAGDVLEPIMSSTGAGSVQAYSAGVKMFAAVEAGASGQIIRCLPISYVA